MADQFLNVDEASEFLRIKKSWLYQNHKISGIPCHFVGRKLIFEKNELSEWVRFRSSK